jgi:hypothetical protein
MQKKIMKRARKEILWRCTASDSISFIDFIVWMSNCVYRYIQNTGSYTAHIKLFVIT